MAIKIRLEQSATPSITRTLVPTVPANLIGKPSGDPSDTLPGHIVESGLYQGGLWKREDDGYFNQEE